MAKYTIELRNVCEYYGRDIVESWFKDYDLTDYLTEAEIEVINNRGTWNKDKLARQIVDNYFMREIGQETPALFSLYAKNKMRLIMEEKLPLIYSASIKYDPLVNVDYTETFTRDINRNDYKNTTNNENGNSSSNDTTNQTASGLTVNSDTPQGQISKNDILTGKFASQTQAGESSSNNTSNSTINSSNTGIETINGNSKDNENYTKNVKGNSGVSATAQKMIEQYRENIKTINKDIINELNILFMGLF